MGETKTSYVETVWPAEREIMAAKTPLDAMQSAAWHLRMQLAGNSSYSGTPGKIDKGWAELLLERLDDEGFRVVEMTADEKRAAGWILFGASPEPGSVGPIREE